MSKIIHLTKVCVPKYPLVKRVIAMTIGLGFVCTDGVVICADRQHTSENSYKFADRKIFRERAGDCHVLFCYAGDRDSAQMMVRKTTDALRKASEKNPTFGVEDSREVLEAVFKDEQAGGLQTLIAISTKSCEPFLLRTWDSRVVDGDIEYIGWGDGSVLKYLSNILLRGRPRTTVDQAEILGTYLVSVASRYVDKCGLGIDRAVLHNNGMIGEGTGEIYEHQGPKFNYFENEIGEELRKFLIGK
jgi:hypothetical protein